MAIAGFLMITNHLWDVRKPRKDIPDVAWNVRTYRELAGMTQEQLAVQAGLSTVAMLESGARANPRVTTLKKIATAFSRALGYKVTVADLRSAPVPSTVAVSAQRTLAQFLASGLASVSAEEIDQLRQQSWPWGRAPTVQAWYHVLMAIRALKAREVDQ